jgi:hypothetical protein
MERPLHLALGPITGLLDILTRPRRVRTTVPGTEHDRLFSDAIERELERRTLH